MAGSSGYRVRVRVRDQLSAPWWSERFSGISVTAEADGSTLLGGHLPDQSAFHGLLAAIRDLGLSLVSVEMAAAPPPASRDRNGGNDDGAGPARGGSR